MTEENMNMTDPTPGDDTAMRPVRKYPGMPRWVKVSGSIFIGLVLLVVVVFVVTSALGLHTPAMPGPMQHGTPQP